MALAKARRNPLYEGIADDCYGVAFFGMETCPLSIFKSPVLISTMLATPHRGSNYLSMPDISSSIQSLLHLSQPLPRSITDELRVGHALLLHIDEEFRVLASDLQVWTFYETIESRISGQAESRPGEVYFTTSITSVKSAILGIRQETIYPLQSDHANCASFGKNNAQTMKLFLKALAKCVTSADENSGGKSHTPMNLEQKVPIEVHGFYEDPVAVTNIETLTTIRAWSTRVALKDFLDKGPVECINDRLNEVNDGPTDEQYMAARRRTTRLQERDLPSPPAFELGENLLGIGGTLNDGRSANSETALLSKPSPMSETSPIGSPNLAAANGDERGRSEQIPEPEAVRSRSTSGTRTSRAKGVDIESPRSRRRVALTRRFTDQFNAKWTGPLERTFFQGSPFGPSPLIPATDPLIPVFAKPDEKNRRFIWTHLPFTNPAWVKVSDSTTIYISMLGVP